MLISKVKQLNDYPSISNDHSIILTPFGSLLYIFNDVSRAPPPHNSETPFKLLHRGTTCEE